MSTTPTVSYNLINAYICCLKRFCNYKGRACRSEYWFTMLAMLIFSILSIICCGVVGVIIPDVVAIVGSGVVATVGLVIGFIFCTVFFNSVLSVTVRRLHDTGRSDWNLLWVFVPYIGWLVLLIFLCLGSGEPNRYGEGPASPEA